MYVIRTKFEILRRRTCPLPNPLPSRLAIRNSFTSETEESYGAEYSNITPFAKRTPISAPFAWLLSNIGDVVQYHPWVAGLRVAWRSTTMSPIPGLIAVLTALEPNS
jgi:hypothetical protein